jgi:hypothetical protein
MYVQLSSPCSFPLSTDGENVSTRRLSQDNLECRKAWSSTGAGSTILQGDYQVSSMYAAAWYVHPNINTLVVSLRKGVKFSFQFRERRSFAFAALTRFQYWPPRRNFGMLPFTLTKPSRPHDLFRRMAWHNHRLTPYPRFPLGYIGEFEIVDDHRSNKIVIELNGRINKCGVISPRFDIEFSEIEKWIVNLLPSRQFGHIIISTTYGIMTHEEARRKKTGGKILGFFY